MEAQKKYEEEKQAALEAQIKEVRKYILVYNPYVSVPTASFTEQILSSFAIRA